MGGGRRTERRAVFEARTGREWVMKTSYGGERRARIWYRE